MELNLEYEQDFIKKGKGISKYGGTDFGGRGPRDFKAQQLDKLRFELQKYDITENKRYKITSEMDALNSIEYMNMKYLAAVIMILEGYKGSYQDEDDVNNYIYEIFRDKEKMSFFINKVIDSDKENDPVYMKMVKSVLLTYIFKLKVNKASGYDI